METSARFLFRRHRVLIARLRVTSSCDANLTAAVVLGTRDIDHFSLGELAPEDPEDLIFRRIFINQPVVASDQMPDQFNLKQVGCSAHR